MVTVASGALNAHKHEWHGINESILQTNVVVRCNAVVIESWFVVCTPKKTKNIQLKRPSRIARADHRTTGAQVTPHTVQVSIIVFIGWFLQSLVNASRHIVPNHDIISNRIVVYSHIKTE